MAPKAAQHSPTRGKKAPATGKSTADDKDLKLVGYSDSDWAGDKIDREFTSGSSPTPRSGKGRPDGSKRVKEVLKRDEVVATRAKINETISAKKQMVAQAMKQS